MSPVSRRPAITSVIREDFSGEGFEISHLEMDLLDGLTFPFDNVVHRAGDFCADFFKKHGIA